MEARFETFTTLITKIYRNIRKIKNQEMSKYNLKGTHVSCLYYLYSAEGLTAKELCEKCEEDKATISRSLDYLETNGYLTCKSKSSKKYKTPIMLSEKGMDIGKEIADKINRVLKKAGVGLTEDERSSFYRSLATISNNLDVISTLLDGNGETI